MCIIVVPMFYLYFLSSISFKARICVMCIEVVPMFYLYLGKEQGTAGSEAVA